MRTSEHVKSVLAAVCGLMLGGMARAEPIVQNPSFEIDKYGKSPGYASQNGGRITGWQYTGSVGINPYWDDPATQRGVEHAFTDNGLVPHGRQVCFLQNKCELRQTIAGFEAGRRYQVTYYENARHNRAPERNPRLTVTLGGETIVSLHAIKPVENIEARTLPYNFVESAVFAAPATGSFDLVFTTTFPDRVAALIDNVQIVALGR
jgi:hypothetical protein